MNLQLEEVGVDGWVSNTTDKLLFVSRVHALMHAFPAPSDDNVWVSASMFSHFHLPQEIFLTL